MSLTLTNVLYAAAREARVIKHAGGVLNANGLADGLLIANQIVDEWAARRAYAWSDSFTLFTLTPPHNPYLIGPGLSSPDFAAATRPERIEQNGAALVLTNISPAVDLPLNIRDADWWNNQRIKTLATNVPTDLYYEPDNPNGSLFFWPVPNFAYGVRLRLRNVLAQFALVTTVFSAPQAYLRALTLTIAEQYCAWYGLAPAPDLAMRANRARNSAQVNNIKSPRIASADFGTRGTRTTADFDYYSGGPK
jgi:hypothetical protein